MFLTGVACGATGYGRVHRGCDGRQAMPTFEQNTPVGPLPHARQPSVHAAQFAFAPLANSSNRGSVSGLEAEGAGC
jgi:hypothetical protein